MAGKRLWLALGLLLALALRADAAIAVLDSGAAGSLNTTTAAVTLTSCAGATGIIVFEASFGASTPTDTSSNTYTSLTAQVGVGTERARLWYKASPATSSSMTFTLTADAASTYPSISVLCISGSQASSPFDQQNSATAGIGGVLQPGSVTPSENNEIAVTGVAWFDDGTNTASIDSGYTPTTNVLYLPANHAGGRLGYLVQTSAGATNPTWTWGAAVASSSAVIATFKEAGGAATIAPVLNSPILVGRAP